MSLPNAVDQLLSIEALIRLGLFCVVGGVDQYAQWLQSLGQSTLHGYIIHCFIPIVPLQSRPFTSFYPWRAVQVCVASGKLIKDLSTAVCCKTCKQYTSSAERQDKDICAMCHSALPLGPSMSLMTSLSYLDTEME